MIWLGAVGAQTNCQAADSHLAAVRMRSAPGELCWKMSLEDSAEACIGVMTGVAGVGGPPFDLRASQRRPPDSFKALHGTRLEIRKEKA